METHRRRRLTQAGLETLARIASVGECTWFAGAHVAHLEDAWRNALNATVVDNLIADGYLAVDQNGRTTTTVAGAAALQQNPGPLEIARAFYTQQSQLAAAGIRLNPDRPNFARQGMSREIRSANKN
jgi:hypothetical protein